MVFKDYDEVFEFARANNIVNITVTRRELTSELVSRIREQGFQVGSFHCRTTDELTAALSLGVDYIAADFFKGPSVESYPGARISGTPLFDDLHSSGFYRLRDWIWELGAGCEKFRVDSTIPSSVTGIVPEHAADGILSFNHQEPVTLRLCIDGKLSDRVLDVSKIKIPDTFLGDFDRRLNPAGITFEQFLSEDEQVRSFKKIADELLARRDGLQSPELNILHSISFDDIAALAEGEFEKVLRGNTTQVSADQLLFLEELSNEFLIRTGRVIGVLAFAALVPRHGPKQEYSVFVDADLCTRSRTVRNAVVEQVQAQLLRSGKSGTTSFSS